jgi:glycine C-acetyltransferase
MPTLDWIDDELQALRDAGLYNHIRTLGTAQGAWLEVDGRRVLNFCSNNYLGLANHPRLVQAAREAMEEFGVGPGAVRTIAGTMDLHVRFDLRLAKFKGVAGAISLQSGFAANLAVIPALVGKEDAIVSDALNHASIIDGCKLSGAKILRYEHCDTADLARVLAERRADFRRCLVVTDGVFRTSCRTPRGFRWGPTPPISTTTAGRTSSPPTCPEPRTTRTRPRWARWDPACGSP